MNKQEYDKKHKEFKKWKDKQPKEKYSMGFKKWLKERGAE